MPARISLIVSFCALLFVGDICAAEKVFKVGVIVAMTGEGASIGEAFKNGMQIAIDGLSEADRGRLQFIYEDDALSGKMAVSAFNKLNTSSNIDALINLSSGTGKALAPLAERQRLPFISVATDPAIVEGREWPVLLWVTPEEEAKVMIPEMERRGYRTVARISTIHEGVMAGNAAFDQLNQGRFKLVLDEQYPPDAKDFKPYISKLRAAPGVDAVQLVLMPGHLGIFAKQARQLGINLPFFGWEILEDNNEVKIAEGALEGAWYVSADDPDDSFTKEYRRRFPQASFFTAPNGHDAVMILAQAIKQSKGRDDLRRFLRNLKDFTGAMGTYSASGDGRYTLPAAVKVVTKQGFAKLLPGQRQPAAQLE
ncbi:MAG: hypothetical protein DCC75_06525 [Proteobacteria bacterium]|nr:MAG: hypothetical protein DCC75_06525 [Pseudomonadota bacterium]